MPDSLHRWQTVSRLALRTVLVEICLELAADDRVEFRVFVVA